MTGEIEVVASGVLTTIQDLGRPGHAHLGVPRSGALDGSAHRLANGLVGNPASSATLEVTALGCVLRARARITVAITGAPCEVHVGSVAAPWGAPVRLGVGQFLHVGPATSGVRTYVAVRGGIDGPLALGSRAADLLSGLGPRPLADGDLVDVVDSLDLPPTRFGRPAAPAHYPGEIELSITLGPRHTWLTADAVAGIAHAAYTVADRSNRVGIRLAGPALAHGRTDELASEGIVLGAVQVPPDGQPVVFLNDHPTTGGYPVIGVIDAPGIAAAAQARPGTTVRFRIAP